MVKPEKRGRLRPAPSKPVSLTVHKNQKARRRAKEFRDDIKSCAGNAQRVLGTDWAGYCVVVWGADGTATAWWDGEEKLGPVGVPEYAHLILSRMRSKQDIEE